MVPGTPFTPRLDEPVIPLPPKPRVLPNPLAIAAAGSVVLGVGASRAYPAPTSRAITPDPPRTSSIPVGSTDYPTEIAQPITST
jgi:hypothetical protein